MLEKREAGMGTGHIRGAVAGAHAALGNAGLALLVAALLVALALGARRLRPTPTPVPPIAPGARTASLAAVATCAGPLGPH